MLLWVNNGRRGGESINFSNLQIGVKQSVIGYSVIP